MSRFNLISLALVFGVTVFQAEASRFKRNALDNTVSTTIPASFDYRDHGKVTPVKTQGECGSSYTFAAVAAIESQYLIRKNQSLDLAEQIPLNCDIRSTLCYSDDLVSDIFNFAKTEGLPLESCLPYTSGSGFVNEGDRCDACAGQRNKVAGFRQYGLTSTAIPKTFSEDKIAEDLYNFGPAAITMYFPHRVVGGIDQYDNVNHLIANYAGGVMDWTPTTVNCSSMYSFLLVGYTPDFWIAKASLGPNWGENGYFRFKRGTGFYSFRRAVYAPYLEDEPITTTTTTTTVPPTTTKPTTTTKAPITTTTVPPVWSEWASTTTCTADCGLCGKVVMTRTCTGSGTCPGSNTMNSTTPCGGAGLCPFGLGFASCCAPAKRAIVNGSFACA